MTPPKISGVSACGTGPDMTITLTGTFGPTPWNLASNQFSGHQTLYVQAAMSGSKAWNAGISNQPPVTVGLGNAGWYQGNLNQGTKDTIIFGFDSNYGVSGQVVHAGDKIGVTVFSPLNGQPSPTTSSATVVAPAPALVTFDTVPPQARINVGSTTSIPGWVLDSSFAWNCGIADIPVALSVSEGSTMNTTTGSDGTFQAAFNASVVGGNVTMTAKAGSLSGTATIAVLPVLTSLSKTLGIYTGQQQITLTGSGFDSSTIVAFEDPVFGNITTAIVNNASPDHHTVTLTTPMSPSGGSGPVLVYANVNGAVGGPLQYTYFVPGQPLGTIEENVCQAPPPYHVTVTVYNADGTIDPVKIDLSYGGAIGGAIFEVVQSGVPFVTDVGIFMATNETNSVSIRMVTHCFTSIRGPGMLPTFIPPGKNCINCGNSANMGIWTYGEATAETNSVVISGRPARQIQQTYTVGSIDTAIFNQLVALNPFVVTLQRTTASATFIGQPISIQLTKRLGVNARITDAAQVVFAVPANAGQNLQVVHFAQTESGLGWTAVKGTTYLPEEGMIHAPANETGIYALVSIGAQQ
jgi:IPT/TIG domain